MSKKVDGSCEEAIGANNHLLFLGQVLVHLAFYLTFEALTCQKLFEILQSSLLCRIGKKKF